VKRAILGNRLAELGQLVDLDLLVDCEVLDLFTRSAAYIAAKNSGGCVTI